MNLTRVTLRMLTPVKDLQRFADDPISRSVFFLPGSQVPLLLRHENETAYEIL
jgi:hypothetical protein